MKKEKEYVQLVKILNETQPCTAAALANTLGISVRTVKNYIHNINTLMPQAISSSQKGYSISYENVTKLLDMTNSKIPQTSDERVFYILRLLLQCLDGEQIDMYDLADELYVSISTLNLDLQKIRAAIAPFDLSLVTNSNQLSLCGTERNKRKLLGDILYQESNTNFLNLTSLNDKFVDIDFDFIQTIVLKTFSANHFYINDFSLNNLIVHIAISIDRIRHNSISTQNMPLFSDEHPVMTVTSAIAGALETHFHIRYSTAERNELSLLILSRASAIDYESVTENNIRQYVGQDCLELVRHLIAMLRTYYDIDFPNTDFLIRFALHIQSLFIRFENNRFSKNPLTQNIKSSCPFIYEVAVMMASTIQQKTGIIINDDEIAYIAIHVGSMLEEQQNLRSRITAVLYCPGYYNIVQNLAAKINQAQENHLVITAVLTDEAKLALIPHTELIISILPLEKTTHIPVVQITPFFTSIDQRALFQKINALKKEKERSEFNGYLRQLFKPDLFEKVQGFHDYVECIEYMVEKLVRQGYTNPDFLSDVLEREHLSSTAFKRFAIPHALDMKAHRTAFYVVICNKPVLWGNQSVSIVIMMCFNKNDRAIFHKVFEPLTMILNETDKLKRLTNTDSYDAFIETLVSML